MTFPLTDCSFICTEPENGIWRKFLYDIVNSHFSFPTAIFYIWKHNKKFFEQKYQVYNLVVSKINNLNRYGTIQLFTLLWEIFGDAKSMNFFNTCGVDIFTKKILIFNIICVDCLKLFHKISVFSCIIVFCSI